MLYVQQKDNRRLEKATEINTLLKERLNMEQIVKMINGVIHTSGCTLSCEYCYLAQANYKNEIGIKKAARFYSCSKNTIKKWCHRYATYGLSGLIDRSRKPKHSPKRIK